VWTKTPPTGWSIDDTGVPGAGDPSQDGVTEWAGWSFAKPSFWIQDGGQNRNLFIKGTNVIAIADSDEWDDTSHAAGNMATYLKTKSISLAGVKPGSVIVKYDSSWNPEEPQKANVTVSFDGGAPVEIFRYESATTSPNYRPTEFSETIAIPVNNPAGATNMVITFGYFDTRNNWWWAIDNLQVLGEAAGAGLTDGLVLHLKFDGNLSDSSGRGNNGTAVGVPGFVAGKIGSSALTFTSKKDGSSFNYVTLGTPADLNFSSNVNFTVSFWAKLTNWVGDPSFIANKDWGSGNNRGWVIAADSDGRIQWNLGGTLAGASGDRKDYDGPAGTFTNGGWHHIVTTFDRAGNGVTYVDGAKLNHRDGRAEIPIATPPNDLGTPVGQAVNIGQDGKGTYTDGGSVEVNGGMIDDVAIWRRALSATEVAKVYELGQAGQDVESKLITDDLVLHLTFDGNLTDTSGRGNNGTAVGAPGFGAGQIGSSLVFTSKKDGSSFNYVTLGSPSDLNFSSNVNFSVSFWAKLTNWVGDPSFVANKDWGSGNNRGWVIAADSDGRIQWNLGGTLAGASGDRKDYDGPAGTFTNSGWHHIVATFDRASNAVTYVDGVKLNHRDGRAEVLIATPPNDLATPAGQAVNIGQDGKGTYTDGGSVEVNGGLIDDVGIWRRVLSASEVAGIYQNGQQGRDFTSGGTGQLPGELRITATLSGANLTLTWSGGPGIRLQRSANLNTPSWSDVAGTEGQSSASVSITGTESHFRLFKP
jgi:hypothetical protein